MAKDSGVSHQTVSRVLNNQPAVSDKTRKLVLESINKLNYTVNSAAKSLASGKHNKIGVINLNSTLHGPVSLQHAIYTEANLLGFAVHYATVEKADSKSIDTEVKKMVKLGVDGILVIAPRLLKFDHKHLIEKLDIAIIFRDHESTPEGIKWNQKKISATATNYLLDLGHKDILYIAGESSWYDARERTIGWKAVAKANGISTKLSFSGDWSSKSGYEICIQQLRVAKFSAILASSDIIALGVLKALNDNNRLDISVISMDNMKESEYYYPSLTAVDVDWEEMGKRYFRYLVSKIEKKEPEVYLTGERISIIERDSTRVYKIDEDQKPH